MHYCSYLNRLFLMRFLYELDLNFDHKKTLNLIKFLAVSIMHQYYDADPLLKIDALLHSLKLNTFLVRVEFKFLAWTTLDLIKFPKSQTYTSSTPKRHTHHRANVNLNELRVWIEICKFSSLAWIEFNGLHELKYKTDVSYIFWT